MENSRFVTYHPEIPALPVHLQELAKTVIGNDNVSGFGDIFDNFCIYNPPKQLETWIKQYFDLGPIYKLHVRTIKNVFPPHVDSGIESVTSFLIETGGETHTAWHTSIDNNSEIIEDHVIPKGVWHTIDVKSPHSVFNIDPDKLRIMVSVEKITPTGFDFDDYRRQAKLIAERSKTYL